MPKLNQRTVRTATATPVTTRPAPSGRTREGAPGYERDEMGELFLLAIANLVSEKTFYEAADIRDARYRHLIRTLAVTPDGAPWLTAFLPWLRTTANMRTAAAVGAAELARARQEARLPGWVRPAAAGVLQRADEPGELLAYWLSRYGKPIPAGLVRGVADALPRLYTERNVLKWDSAERAVRFADVIELTQPRYQNKLYGTWNDALYGHLIGERHGRGNPVPGQLPLLAAHAELMAIPVEERRAAVTAPAGWERLRHAGMTWEALSGWLQGPMDAAIWEAIIPSMMVGALIRNLRNFDQAGVSDRAAEWVTARLTSAEDVTAARQFPFRYLTAYRQAPSARWAYPLERALNLSLALVPRLAGRTLILVDTSTSMDAPFSDKGQVRRWDAAAMFGVALAQRCDYADVVSYSALQVFWHDPTGERSRVFEVKPLESLLRSLDRWKDSGFNLGGGTETAATLRKHYRGHDRVIILTDEQAAGGYGRYIGDVGNVIPESTPLITFNLAGYRHGHAPSGSQTRITIGGLNDAAFRVIQLAEAGRDARWGDLFAGTPQANTPVA